MIQSLVVVFAGLSATVAPVNGGNALTLPSSRHLFRFGATELLAVQQDGMDGRGLGWFRSDDSGASWSYYAPIQNDASERDVPDAIAVGNDLALVYGYETPNLDVDGGTSHDVYFQQWRGGGGDWSPATPVRVFDSTSNSTAYYRPSIARDSAGRLWVQAFKLEANGSHSAVVAVSSDEGAHFTVEPALTTGQSQRLGGRIISLGNRLLFLFGTYGVDAAYHRVRSDGSALSSWGPLTRSFDEGLYHGASFSAVTDGSGGLHLAYKDWNAVLWYRHFDGARFDSPVLLEDQGDWELQPAISRVGGDLALFYNRVLSSGYNDELRTRRWHAGSWSDPEILDGGGGFRGYPATVETLQDSVGAVPCAWGVTPTANDPGEVDLFTIAWSSDGTPAPDLAPPPPPPDMSVARDLSTARDAATTPRDFSTAPRDFSTARDLSTAPRDLSSPPAQDAGSGGALLFADDFARTHGSSLGASWVQVQGAWLTDGQAETDSDSPDVAIARPASCSGCLVSARVVGFGVPEVSLFARAPSTASTTDRYEVTLLGSGRVQLRRRSAGRVTVLAEGASGLSALDAPATLALHVSGSATVSLRAEVDGRPVAAATDGAPPTVLRGAGYAGLYSTSAGVVYQAFRLFSE